MRKAYSYDKLSIRNTDLYYQVANEGGEVWYQCSGISRILDLSAGSKLAASAAVQNKRPMSCEWIRNRNVSWFLNTEGIKDILRDRVRNPRYLSRGGQVGYALLQSFVRMQAKPEQQRNINAESCSAEAKPEQQALPMPMPTPEDGPALEPVELEPVNTGANQTFFFRGQNVRTVIKDGEPWFVAKDVCEALGIEKYRDAVAALDPDERVSTNMDTLGGKQSMTAVSESGLYALVFKSRKPEAKAFRKWVTSEVLPALRKTGHYAMPKAPEPAPCKTWGDNNMPTAAMLEEFRAWKGVAVECGLDNNAACISANGVLDRNYGVSPLQIARIQLIAPGNEQYLKPSAIADILAQEGLCDQGLRGAQTVNAALAHMGLQTNTKDSITGKNNWLVTVSGKEAGARIIDTTKRDNHGRMVQQILWPLSIVDTLKAGFFRHK